MRHRRAWRTGAAVVAFGGLGGALVAVGTAWEDAVPVLAVVALCGALRWRDLRPGGPRERELDLEEFRRAWQARHRGPAEPYPQLRTDFPLGWRFVLNTAPPCSCVVGTPDWLTPCALHDPELVEAERTARLRRLGAMVRSGELRIPPPVPPAA